MHHTDVSKTNFQSADKYKMNAWITPQQKGLDILV